MTIPYRKYMTEFSVALCSGRWLLVHPAELLSGNVLAPEDAAAASKCHIYLIVRRPSASIDPNTFSHNDAKLTGHLIYKTKGVLNTASFSYALPDSATAVQVAPYPHREVQTLASDGKIVRVVPGWVISLGVPALRVFEVLYVGQAYGDGSRTALDRLKSHSTLQKILADMQYRYPDDEAMIITLAYEPYQIVINVDGNAKTAIQDDSDTDRVLKALSNELTEHRQICLAEAGLIRYFRPSYNEIFKESFPASDQKILTECIDLDFSGLVVEIDTKGAGQLYSEAVPARVHHIALFNLVDSTVRRSFFTFVGHDGNSSTMPDVIPRSR